MEQDRPSVLDLRRSAQVWQRVAPGMEPFPAADTAAVPAMAPQTAAEPMAAAQPAVSGQETAPAQAAISGAGASPGMYPASANLPGAVMDPCCMGSAAADMLGVITGFVDECLTQCRQLNLLARQGPAWARQKLRQAAAEEEAHAKRLLAVYYLITGTCYHPPVCRPCPRQGGWCAALREQYHLAACTAFNYARAADGTTDPCLSRLFSELSQREYQSAEVLTALLERSLGC